MPTHTYVAELKDRLSKIDAEVSSLNAEREVVSRVIQFHEDREPGTGGRPVSAKGSTSDPAGKQEKKKRGKKSKGAAEEAVSPLAVKANEKYAEVDKMLKAGESPAEIEKETKIPIQNVYSRRATLKARGELK